MSWAVARILGELLRQRWSSLCLILFSSVLFQFSLRPLLVLSFLPVILSSFVYLSDSHEEEHCLNTPQTPRLVVGPVMCAHRASSHEQSLPQTIFNLIRTPAPHRDEDPEDLLRITEPLGAPCICLHPSPQSVVCATEATLGADESLLIG